MKFGILNWNCHPPDYPADRQLQEVVELARTARDAGFDSFAVNHTYLRSQVRWFQPVPLLARLATETGSMSLVLGVFILPFHNPVHVAEELATLDIICGGRLVFGVGIGPGEAPWDAFGLDPGERTSRFEESLQLVQRLWAEDEVTHQGKHFSLVGAHTPVRPLQDPHPPIWIGALHPRAIRRAARMADAWYPPLRPLPEMERGLEIYQRCLEQYGRTAPAELPYRQEVLVAKDREVALNEFRRYVEGPLRSRIGAPVDPNACFAGAPGELVDQIGQHREALGDLHIIFRVEFLGLPHKRVLEQVELLGSRVLPYFRT